jgi:hypothetical protein
MKGEWGIKKVSIFFMVISLLVFAFAGVSSAWQGRMGGMGDPYGLVQDESDFLINPSDIGKGEGIKFYGNYRFTYTGVTDWDYHLDQFNTAGALTAFYNYDTSGQEYKHNALVGAGFPLGPGRMGLFFTYDGTRGDYDGNVDILGVSNFADCDLTKDLDNFALRLLYGFPVLGMNAGLELGAAYRDEEKKWWVSYPPTKNDVWPTDYPQNLHSFMNPYDSQYWEILWKAGVGRKFNAASFDWTIKGGNIISSNNEYEFSYTTGEHVVMGGDVAGFRIGTDLWVRYQMNDALTLPFVVSVDYSSKHRDGDGIGTGWGDFGSRYTYAHQETNFEAKVGGGVEKKINANGLISAALYYDYVQGREHQWFQRVGAYIYDFMDFPLHKEHRLEMSLAGELELSPSVTLRMGLNPFYGWVVTHDFQQAVVGSFTDDISADGYSWGINTSLGGTVKFPRLALEPFINVGYRSLKLKGDGPKRSVTGVTTGLWEIEQNRSEWYIGGGFSVLFGL